jgi:hypothetical protein
MGFIVFTTLGGMLTLAYLGGMLARRVITKRIADAFAQGHAQGFTVGKAKKVGEIAAALREGYKTRQVKEAAILEDARNAAFQAGHAAGFAEGRQDGLTENTAAVNRAIAQATHDGFQEGFEKGRGDGIGHCLVNLHRFIDEEFPG